MTRPFGDIIPILQKTISMNNMADKMISDIKAVADSVVPTGGQVWPFGSRARGDAREEPEPIIRLNQR